MNSQSTVQELPSVCPLDCPDTCSLKVTVKDGKISKVRGSKVNPFTKGSVCTKVAKYYPEFVHGEHRLTEPLLRTGPKGSGAYRVVSWDEALEHVHTGLQAAIDAYGSQSVIPLNYAGPHGKLAGGSMDERFFARLGSSQLNRSPLCGGVRSLSYKSMFGSAPGMSPEQVEFSDLIIIWGTNITVSNLHLMRCINVARKQGAKLVVIDPRETQIAKQADLFLQVTPGSDVCLAMKALACLKNENALNTKQLEDRAFGLEEYLTHIEGYINEDVADICGIDTAKFESFLQLCRDSKRLALSTGVGLERTRNGGAAIRAAQTFPLLLGSIGQKGHGIMGNYSAAFKANDLLRNKADVQNSSQKRVFNIVDIANHLLDETLDIPIKAVFIYNHNPVATHPEQNKMRKALTQDDLFVVGCDVQMNDSMKYADVILPACTHFEHQDVYSAYGHGYLQRADAVIPAVGSSLPNTEIFRRVAAKFGYSDESFTDTDTELVNQAFDLNETEHGVNKPSDLEADQIIVMQSIDRLWLCDEELTTQTGLIELHSQQLESAYQHKFPEFKPLAKKAEFILISPASSKRINASFGGSTEQKSERVEINPIDAKKHDLNEGEQVIVSNALGEVELVATITQAVAAGVLCCEKGAWCQSSGTGQTINALISNQSKTDIGDGAAFYDTFVDIRKIG